MPDLSEMHFWEEDLKKEFAQIEILSRMDWEQVAFKWKNKKYGVRAFMDNTKSGEVAKHEVLFGFYDLDDPEVESPIGYFSGEVEGDKATFSMGGEKFINRTLPEIETKGLEDLFFDEGGGLTAVFLKKEYRNLYLDSPNDSRVQIAYLLHAIVLATLSSIGVSESVYECDTTVRKNTGRTKQYQGSGLLTSIEYPSFYTKYTKVINQNVRPQLASPDTTISTSLTGYFRSLLKQGLEST